MLNQPGPIFSCQFVFLFFLQHSYRQMIRKVNEKNIESYFLEIFNLYPLQQQHPPLHLHTYN